MELEYKSDNHDLGPAQSVDSEADFPEFDYPRGDKGHVRLSKRMAWLTVRKEDASQSDVDPTWGLLRPGGEPVNDSPKKMPGWRRSENHTETVVARNDGVPDITSQPEVSKHVVAEESNLNSTLQPAQPSQRKVLEKNPSFKSVVNISVTESESSSTDNMDVDHKNGNSTDVEDDSDHMTMPLPPTGKRSSINPGSLTKLQSDGKTSEKARPSTLKVDVLKEKYSGGARSRRRDDAGRAVSPSPVLSSPRKLSSPRQTTPQRSTSPLAHLKQDQISGAGRVLSPIATGPRHLTSPRRPVSQRSTSPLPNPNSSTPKARQPSNHSDFDGMAKSPRYVTPTRAASLKTVKAPPAQAASVPAFGITTPIRAPIKKTTKEAPPAKVGIEAYPTLKVKTAACPTQPSGFNFRTDERAEKRREYYSQLEGRLKAKEAERKQLEAKVQEEKELQLRELRRSLNYKANPVPSFYQEPAPPPIEIKKTPPTRAKSPTFTPSRRRDSCPPPSSSRSPLRSRTLVRNVSFDSNPGSSTGNSQVYSKSAPRIKQPFVPV